MRLKLPMPPKPPLLILGLFGFAGLLVTLVVVVFILRMWWSTPIPVLGLGEAPEQPVAFTHVTHAGNLGIDCQFCHRTVASEAAASIPAVQQCMFCHQVIGAGNKEIDKVRTAFQTGDPIEWKRVHRLPEHVQFFHSPHIQFFTEQKGMETQQVCSICHGDIKTMTKVEQVRNLKMRDCVDCHRNNNAPTDCTTCHY